MSSSNAQLFRLTQFYRSHIQPLRREQQPSLRPYEANYVRAGRLEAYWWLHFGVDLNYFPRDEARSVVIEFSDLLFGDLEQLVETQGDVFAPLMRLLWVQAARTKEVFPELQGKIVHTPSRLLPRFCAACSSSTRFGRESGRLLLPALFFANQQTWEELSHDSPSPDGVAKLFEIVSKPKGRNGLCADFFEVLQHMADMRTFFLHSGSEAVIRQENVPQVQQLSDSILLRYAEDDHLFEERVGMIQRWRLNLWQRTVEERFLQIAEASDDLFRGEFQAREWPLTAALKEGAFMAYVRGLMHNWKSRGGEQWLTAQAHR